MSRLWSALLLLVPALALATPVTLTSADGTSLHAEVSGKGTRGVVLVHGEGGSTVAWDKLRERLASQGYQVVAVDLRGHGTSKGAADDAGWPHTPDDVRAAVKWLTSHGATKVALVGAEAGGVVALAASGGLPVVDSVVLVSPRLSAPGLKVSEALTALGARPLLFVTGSTDTTGVRAAAALAPKATGPQQTELVPEGTVGIRLFDQSSTLEGMLIRWLADGGPPPVPVADRPMTTTSGGDLQTTGTRYGE